ncbi:MAG: hypothetical protein GF344_17595 [Chitinivibrionales bacterium]|nr:hypothetical protein [Chitinivibrionales bacterium]MBD3358482.1 hypothetical protein [Chitinivibrionales bacterium]
MNIPRLSIHRPLMMIMVIVALALFGTVSFFGLPVDLMPEMDLPFITVQCIYPGAGPEEIETNVSEPIEDQMTTISGLKNMTSYCMEGVMVMVLEFKSEMDVDMVAIDVKDKVDAILYELPPDMEKPIIGKFDPNDEPIVSLSLMGDIDPKTLRQQADRNLKDRIARLEGVAKVDVTGGREREIVVDLQRDKLGAHGLSVINVFPLIVAQSANFPAGHVTGDYREYTVRVEGEFESLDQIARIKIPVMKMGRKPIEYTVELQDIATITDSHKEIRELARFNRSPAVQIDIRKRPDANTVAVADRIVELVNELNQTLPPGLELAIAQDRSEFIRNSVADTYLNMAIGIFLTSLILLIFLGDWRLTLIAVITMPASVIIAFTGMSVMGFSLNIVTLMALSISVGILVTNAIVVLENIVRHRNVGQKPFRAAETGTNEILLAVLASTLTNLAVFIPIATTGGITGNIFRALGLTIVFATLASLLLSFTLTPMMASRLLREHKGKRTKKSASDAVMRKLEKGYGTVLSMLVHNRLARIGIIIGTVVFFFVTMGALTPHIGQEFMTQGDEGYIQVNVELPPGTPLSVTDSTVAIIEDRLRRTPEVHKIAATIGGGASGINSGVNLASLVVELKPESERTKSTAQVVQELRPELADLPDAILIISESSAMASGASESDIQVEVVGENMDEVLALADSVETLMATRVSGLTDINSSWKGAKPEIKLIPNRERLEHYGLSMSNQITVQTIGGLLRFTLTGNDQATFREGGEEYPIRVRLDPTDRNTIEEIENLPVPTMKGMVPVKAIADVVYESGASTITRKNRQRMITVNANVAEGTSGGKVAEIRALTENIQTKPGYSIGFGGDQEMMEESFGELMIAGGLAIALTYMLLVALLESLLMALVIWLTLPLGLIGVVWALFLTGNSFSMMANMSIIMLIGIVVNNAILLIDYARQERLHRGLTAVDAIVSAGKTKLKAIIMMNLAIVVAMIPQALALGSGGEFRAPFAITAIGGILVSTALTLFVIPVLYVVTAPKKLDKDLAAEHA